MSEAKTKPISFSAPMVWAIRADRKTQTRRLIEGKPQRVSGCPVVKGPANRYTGIVDEHGRILRPRYMPGDVLYVRQAWRASVCCDATAPRDIPQHMAIWYEADGDAPEGYARLFGRLRPAMFMCQWMVREWLRVEELRAQRLQDISEDDAKAEGLSTVTKDGRLWKWGIPDRDGYPGTDDLGWEWQDWDVSPREAFFRLWDSIHGKGAAEANPMVWAYTFSRTSKPEGSAA